MTAFTRLFRPSVMIQCAAQQIDDFNLPPPAPRGPRITFRVKRTLTSEPDEAEVSIYNLDPIRERVMVQLFHELGRTPLMIFAGYEAAISRVFAGDVRSMRSHQRTGADYAWVATADDGGDALSELTVSYSTAGWTAQNMIDAAILRLAQGDPAAGIAPYPLTPHPSVTTALASSAAAAGTTFSGVHAGKVTDLLDEAARLVGARWWVADNLLYMAKRGLPTDGLAIVLRRKQWLQEPNDDGSGLVQHSTFFDPNIVPGRQVSLIDETFRRSASPEPYRCEVVEHAGDTRSGPWSTSMHLRRLA